MPRRKTFCSRETTYTQVDNDLLAHIMRGRFHAGELKVLLAIIRQTAGWHRASAEISLSQFTRDVGLSRPAVVKALRSLERKHVIFVEAAGRGKCYGVSHTGLWEGATGNTELLAVTSTPSSDVSQSAAPGEHDRDAEDHGNGHRRNSVAPVTQLLRPETVHPYTPVRTCTADEVSRDASRDSTPERNATVTLLADGNPVLPETTQNFTINGNPFVRATARTKERERKSLKKVVGGIAAKPSSPLLTPSAASMEKATRSGSQGGLRPPFEQAPLRRTLKVGVPSHA